MPRQLLTVDDGGHEFDMAGEIPPESAIITAVVGFFVRTLMEHQPLPPGS